MSTEGKPLTRCFRKWKQPVVQALTVASNHGHTADGPSGLPPASGFSSTPNTHRSIILQIQAFAELTERMACTPDSTGDIRREGIAFQRPFLMFIFLWYQERKFSLPTSHQRLGDKLKSHIPCYSKHKTCLSHSLFSQRKFAKERKKLAILHK